jgi:hypothetical protein
MNRSRKRCVPPRTAVVVALTVAVLAVSGRAPAQEKPTPSPSPSPATEAEPRPAQRGTRPGDEQKVFVLRHTPARRLATLLEVFPAQITFVHGDLEAIAVSAKPAVLAAIEATIDRLDQPAPGAKKSRPNVELKGYVLEALSEAKEPLALPAELDRVVAQLKETLRYPAYRLLDVIVARGSEGSRFQASGIADKGDLWVKHADAFYHLIVGRALVEPGPAPRMVALQHFEFELEVPVPVPAPVPLPAVPPGINYRKIGVNGHIDIREGEHVVVGKSGLTGSDNAIVLVLSAKIVE